LITTNLEDERMGSANANVQEKMITALNIGRPITRAELVEMIEKQPLADRVRAVEDAARIAKLKVEGLEEGRQWAQSVATEARLIGLAEFRDEIGEFLKEAISELEPAYLGSVLLGVMEAYDAARKEAVAG
jgi:hypothetical protein